MEPLERPAIEEAPMTPLVPPSSKRFKTHLWTAIVMVFVSAGIVCVNIYPSYSCVGISRGWPYDFYFTPYGKAFDDLSVWNFIHALYIGVDLLVAVIILTVVWLLCRIVMRLRGMLKTNPCLLMPLYPLRFQVHLSTAVVMMFIAGGMIWANVCEQRVLRFGKIEGDLITEHQEPKCSETDFLKNAVGENWTIMRWRGHGWPCCLQNTFSYNTITKDGKEDGYAPETTWIKKGFVVNGLSFLAILIATRFWCERLILRRAARMGG